MPKTHRTAQTLFTVLGAAQAAGVSEQTVRRLTNIGVVACIRDSSGRRLFDAAAIEALKQHIASSNVRAAKTRTVTVVAA